MRSPSRLPRPTGSPSSSVLPPPKTSSPHLLPLLLQPLPLPPPPVARADGAHAPGALSTGVSPSTAAPLGGRALSPRGSRLAMASSPTLRRFPCVVAAKVTSRENRIYRHERLRKKVEGTPERPRMSVFHSNKHLHVQVIDDSKMHTLAAASTMQKGLSQEVNYSAGPTIEVAKKVGEAIAKACLEKGITKVVFDRGDYLYHGRIQALADAVRENGLEF